MDFLLWMMADVEGWRGKMQECRHTLKNTTAAITVFGHTNTYCLCGSVLSFKQYDRFYTSLCSMWSRIFYVDVRVFRGLRSYTVTSAVWRCNFSCKGHPITGHEGPEVEQMYCSTLPSTSALDGVGGQRHAPAALPPGKTRYPLYRRLGGPQGRYGRVLKISPPT